MADYKITLLKGDGIGPEIVDQAVKVLDKTAEKFNFTVEYDEALLGGCAIDATGVPLPDETVATGAEPFDVTVGRGVERIEPARDDVIPDGFVIVPPDGTTFADVLSDPGPVKPPPN